MSDGILPPDWDPPGVLSGTACPRCGREMRVRNITLSCACGQSLSKPMSKRRMSTEPETFVERMRESIDEAQDGAVFTGSSRVISPVSLLERRIVELLLYGLAILLLVLFTTSQYPGYEYRGVEVFSSSWYILIWPMLTVAMALAMQARSMMLKGVMVYVCILAAVLEILLLIALQENAGLFSIRLDMALLYCMLPLAFVHAWTALLFFRDCQNPRI